MLQHAHEPLGKRKQLLYALIRKMQRCFEALRTSRCTFIACIDGFCVGAAMELAIACDIAYCTNSAHFCIAETLIGFAADVGLLQIFPKTVKNMGLFRELALTGDVFAAKIAHEIGLIARIFSDETQMWQFCIKKIAPKIAAVDSDALKNIKRFTLHALDHAVSETMEYAAEINSLAINLLDPAAFTPKTISKSKL